MKRKKKPGGPSKYRPRYVRQAEKLCRLGATTPELGDFFEVTERTIWRWTTRYEAFARAIKLGKGAADDRVEHALFKRAVGYSYETIKIFGTSNGKTPIKEPFIQHVPPDVKACIHWLKNRRPDAWRDGYKHEIETLSDRELAECLAVARRMAEAGEASPVGDDAEGSAQPTMDVQPLPEAAGIPRAGRDKA
jgi:hypothetical protein